MPPRSQVDNPEPCLCARWGRCSNQAKSKDIYRSKGILSFEGQGNTKFVFQGVHETINFGPSANPWKEGEERLSKIVFIGRGLNRDELKAGLEKCLSTPP